jgi:protease IV
MGVAPENDPQDVVSPQVVAESSGKAPAAGQKANRWVFRLLCLLAVGGGLVVLLMLALGSMASVFGGSGDNLTEEKFHGYPEHGEDKIAIITVQGTIIEGDGFVKKQIDHVRDDTHVKAIVLRVDSPGGTVTGSDFIYHHLLKLVEDRKLPLVVSMGGMAASGGYYVSMACGDAKDVIFAEPTTWTGSIGVIIPHYDVSGLMHEYHVSEDSIKSHRLKQMGSPTKPMTEEERVIFQGLVDDCFSRFKEIVKSGRPKFRDNDETLKKVATGQVFTTNQALANGLVDKEGFIEDAIDRAIGLAGLDKKKVRVVKYKRPFGLLDGLLSVHAKAPTSDLAAMLDLSSPRAFYLCTWQPPLLPRAPDAD